MFVENLISTEDLRERTNEEYQKEQMLIEKLQELKQQLRPSGVITDQLVELSDLWPELSDQEKGEMIRAIFQEIVLYTPLTNVKGVKNKDFESEIRTVKYN